MTTITVSPTPAATFTFADFVDFLDWLLIEAVVSNTSPTSFTLSGTYGGQAISVSVTGAALQYQVVGPDTYVIGGTVTELQITADSVDQGTIYTSIDMAVLAPIIADDASGTTPAGIENFFLSADWNYTAAAQVIAPEGALVGDNVAFNPVGNDDVVLSNFDDVLFSGDGNDTVAGGQGNDTVNGGLGDDTLVLQGVLADYTFSANGNGWFTVVDSQTGRDGTDIFTSFENVQFSDTTVQLWSLVGFPGWTFGTSGPDNPFNGTTGNDVLAGLEGDDFIYGFEGEDTFSGGAGNDTIDGGSGTTDDANFFWDAVDYHFEQFQGGFQGVTVNLATGVATDTFGNTDTLIDIERIFGTNFADNITGGNEDEGFDPNGGNDTIDGGGGFDQLIYQIASGVGGFQGINATFTGTNSGTVIDPWGDTDTFSNIEAINGTEFDDTITGNSSDTRYRTLAGNDVIDGGGGFDFADYARDASYGGTGGISFNLNNVDGNGFSQVIDGFGDTDLVKGVFRFRGTGSSDTMVGDNNDSRFDGGDSADVLSGGGGVDDLRGDNGDDVITGGLGNDSLTGGNDADKFIFAVGDGQDTITDFDFAEGDRIVIGSYGFTSTGDFSGFSFNGTDTIIDFNGVDQVTVAGVDLTALVDPNAAFDFAASGNVVQGTPGNDVLNGTGGDDLYLPGDTDPFGEDVLFASGGNDEFDFVGAGPNGGFYSLAYWQLPAFTNLTVTIGVSSGTIVKDGIGTDTLTNIDQIDGFIGGLGLYGPFMGDDTFIIDPFGVKFFDLSIGGGTDTLAVTGVGTVRVGFDAYNGVVVDANAGTATEVGGSSSLTWTGFVRQWRGSNSDDSFTGTSGDEHFITEQGNDTVDGGGGFDTVRYDRAGVTSVRVEYSAQGSAIVTGVWNGTFFTDTLTNIEAVRGARVGLTEFSGSAGDETFIARGGINYFYGDAGNDTLNAGGTRNLFEFDSGSGQDTINNFVIGRDAIDLSSFGFTGTGSFNGYSFDGTNTIIDLNGTDIITVTNVNLTVANASDIFTFNLINGTAGDENAGGLGALNGTANNDVIDGQGGNDELYGNDGNDILRSGGQDFVWTAIDVLNGGAGDDLLVAEGGTVRMIGGAGNDLFVVTNAFGDPWWDTGIADYSSSTSGIIVNLTSGIVSGLQSGQVSDGLGGTDFFQGVNLLRDSDHDDVIVVDGSYITQNGNVFEVRLSGGNDSVDFTGVTGLGRVSWQHASDGVVASLATGTAYDINLGNGDQIGNDTFINANLLRGSQFGDELYGNSGNNFLRGEGGDDYIDGAGGTDMAQYWSSDTGIVVDLSLGTGQVIDDGKGGTDTLVDIERITASIWDDQLTGGSGADWLAGVNGNDVINGGGGDDFLSGDWGTDGGGAGGNDTLTGGTGNDYMVGGDDGDTFVFAAGDGNDTIEDFDFSEGDVIDVSAYGYTSTADFNSINFDGTNTYVDFNGVDGVNLLNVNLTTLPNVELAFDFGGTGGVIYGTVNGEVLNGTSGDDIFDAGGGDDTINGFAGLDQAIYHGAVSEYIITRNIDGSIRVESLGPNTDGTDTLWDVEEMVFTDQTVQDWQVYNGVNLVFGTPGNDPSLSGTPVSDAIYGLSGEDTLTGGNEDYLIGGAGNDTLNGEAPSNGAPTDEVWVSLDYLTEFNTGGSQGIVANLQTGVVIDTYGDTDTVSNIDRIYGTNLADSMTGDASDGQMWDPHGGIDFIDGGGGFDELAYHQSFWAGGLNGITVTFSTTTAGSGTVIDPWGDTDTFVDIDAIRATRFNDTLIGGLGDQRFRGLDGADIMDGGDGFDFADYRRDAQYGGTSGIFVNLSDVDQFGFGRVIDGFGSIDRLYSIERIAGTGSADYMIGDANDNRFDGDNGNDVIYGMDGADILNGEQGDDVIDGGDGTDSVYGGIGVDVLRGGAGNDFISAGEGDDQVWGGDDTDTIFGELGNDWIRGEAGTDYIYGQEGNDWISAGSETDYVFGGIGNDTIMGDDGADYLYGDEGSDWIVAGSGDDYVWGGDDADVIFGEDGVDWIFSELGDDVVFGQAGNDVIFGADGNDAIFGGADTDTIFGQGGNDQLFGEDGGDVIIGGAGEDVIFGGAQGDFLFGGDDTDSIYGGDDADFIYGEGGGDVLFGDNGDDHLEGGAGGDFIFGGYNNDFVIGNEDSDHLYGDHGIDWLFGGTGDDHMYGAGADGLGDGITDIFYMEDNWGNDIIYDYEAGLDLMYLVAVTGLTTSSQLTVTDDGSGNAVVSYGADSITFLDVDVATINTDLANWILN